jgi:putative peptide zinc metalloprotease protein
MLDSHTPTAAADTAAAVPVRASGVELLGPLQGSGYTNAPSLVRRGDGQTLQLTPLLYATLECVDGSRDHEQIAQCLSSIVGKHVIAEDVRCLVEDKLAPLGLLQGADGDEPPPNKANPLLALRWRFVVSNPRVTRRITRPFASLFPSYVVLPVLVLFGLVSLWLLFERGLAAATYEALYRPGLLLLVVALTMVSAAFHELGHAAACRYGGATPGAMGAGIYLVWPAFYTDVTDSYRLSRWGRIRVDIGGLYFNAIFATAMFGVWLATRSEAVLLLIPAQLLQMLRQLPPFVRFDGYHILADVTGVPDLFAHIKPTLLAMLPWRRGAVEGQPLKRWARVVVTVWVLAVVPVLLFSLAMMVKVMPRVVATAWDSLGNQAAVLAQEWSQASWTGVGVRLVAMLAIALPVAAMLYMLFRVARRTVVRTWRATKDRPVRRSLAVLAGVGLVGLLLWLWWPEGQYRPIQPFERGTLVQALSPATVTQGQILPAASQGLYSVPTQGMVELQGSTIAAPPMESVEPRLGVVLTPAADAGAADPPEQEIIVLPEPGTTPPDSDAWPFPFNMPAAPRVGDNQAMATNTVDGSTLYDVEFAMVWVTEDQGQPVDQRNEAYAFARCTDCTTVAVAFQVIFAVGQVDTYVPQNIAMAVNYACEQCDTAALAVQLVVTLTEMPSDEVKALLSDVWDQLDALEAGISELTVQQIHDRLTAVETALLQILVAADPDAAAAADVDSTVDPVVAPTTGDDTQTQESQSTSDETGSDTTTASQEDATQDEDTTAAEPTPDATEAPAAEPTEQQTPAPEATPTPAVTEAPVAEPAP